MKHYTIKQVKPNIFLFSFKDYYEMGMHFVRYQEYYECSSPKFRGKSFEIFDFMKWYSKKYGKDAFTYPKDWGGFNFPASVVREVIALTIPDPNKYDQEFLKGYTKALNKASKKDFYIIGAVGQGSTLRHEIAHGFFYTIPEYKKEMIALVNNLKPEVRKSINGTLAGMGYTSKVWVDETQAYLSTGLFVESNPKFDPKLEKERKPFIKVYRKYYNK